MYKLCMYIETHFYVLYEFGLSANRLKTWLCLKNVGLCLLQINLILERLVGWHG
jgi:hypothetical protein